MILYSLYSVIQDGSQLKRNLVDISGNTATLELLGEHVRNAQADLQHLDDK